MSVTPDARYGLDAQVALRPEPFGALAYHYGNRRLVFLRSPEMVRVVEALDEAPDVSSALDRVGIAAARRPSFLAALEDLEGAEVIRARR